MSEMKIRTMNEEDAFGVAELIYVSINEWYQRHGRPRPFRGSTADTEVYFNVYNKLDPGCGLVAENPRSGRLMGSCFYHPRETHVSLGIMNVHPNYSGQGVAGALVRHITDFADAQGKAVRLVSSAINLDSFSVYNRAGFVPRRLYQDMYFRVPVDGLTWTVPGQENVGAARPDNVLAMADLEQELTHIRRERDYHYFLANADGFWHASVYRNRRGMLDGFLVSCGHPGCNMIGPGVARTEEAAAALLTAELNHHKGRTPVFLIPVDCHGLVWDLYQQGARNCELHFSQVRGEFQPMNGVFMPSFLPESA